MKLFQIKNTPPKQRKKIRALLTLLSLPQANFQKKVIDSLEKLSGQELVDIINLGCSHPNRQVAHKMKYYIGPRYTDKIATELESPRPYLPALKALAFLGLGEINSNQGKAIDNLRKFSNSPFEEVSQGASKILESLLAQKHQATGTSEAPSILEELKDSDKNASWIWGEMEDQPTGQQELSTV